MALQCVKEAVSRGAAGSLLWAVWLCLLQQPSSASVPSACRALCWLGYSLCSLWEWGSVHGSAARWDNAPCCSRESASCRAPGRLCSCQSHPEVTEPWPRTRVTRFSDLQQRNLEFLTRRNELHLFLGSLVPHVAFVLEIQI